MGSFFQGIGRSIRGNPWDTLPGPGHNFGSLSPVVEGRQLGPNGGPYAGVAPTLAGANAGYGGAVQQGASPYAAATPINPYAAAARQATGT